MLAMGPRPAPYVPSDVEGNECEQMPAPGAYARWAPAPDVPGEGAGAVWASLPLSG